MNRMQRPHIAYAFGLLLWAHGMPCLAEPDASKPAQAATSASNAESEPATEANVASGESTKGWLNAQASGTQASHHKQTLSGPVMSKVHERYVKSFTTPVPETLTTSTSK